MNKSISYKNNKALEIYSSYPIHLVGYWKDSNEKFSDYWGYNCNSFSNTILNEIGIKDIFKNTETKRNAPGKNFKFESKEGGK